MRARPSVRCEFRPNSRSTVAGQAFLTGDLRHPDDTVLTEMDSELRERCSAIAERTGVTLRIDDLFYFMPQTFDRICVDAVRNAATRLGYSYMDIVSGAGHDAIYIARVAPTTMIFIPCEGGISHNEAEYAKPEDCAAGADVLLNVIHERASLAESVRRTPGCRIKSTNGRLNHEKAGLLTALGLLAP